MKTKIPKKLALQIAQAYIPELETLEPRGRDSLDFYSVGVRSISKALDYAYLAGYDAAKREIAKMF